MNYKEKLNTIETFVFDIDGVFTDGKIIVDSFGKESRSFNTKDGIAVKLANDLGYNIAIITGANNQGIKARLNRLGIKNVFLNSNDKVTGNSPFQMNTPPKKSIEYFLHQS